MFEPDENGVVNYWMYSRRVDIPETGRGDAAAATWTFRGDESRRLRRVDSVAPQVPRRRVHDPVALHRDRVPPVVQLLPSVWEPGSAASNPLWITQVSTSRRATACRTCWALSVAKGNVLARRAAKEDASRPLARGPS